VPASGVVLLSGQLELPVKVHGPVGGVLTQLTLKLQLVRVLLQTPVDYLLVVDIFHMAVEISSAGQCFVTFRAVVFYIQVNTLLVHFHVSFLVCLVLAVFKITMELAHGLSDFLFAFTGLQKFYVVSSQFSVVIKSLLAIVAFEVFHPIMNYLLVLSKVGERLATKVAILPIRIVYRMGSFVVAVQLRLIHEGETAVVAGQQGTIGVRLIYRVLRFHVFVQIGKLFVADLAGLLQSSMDNTLVPDE
jgi:hypothetical protein